MGMTLQRWGIFCLAVLALSFAPSQGQEKGNEATPLAFKVKCSDRDSVDQDDMCIWVHPSDPSRSALIASDKKANRLFVYDLEGKTLQQIPARYPGNVDVRYGFPLGQEKVDIVALNQRENPRVVLYKVDRRTRRLERVDNDAILTAENYGGTLYRSPKTGKFYFLTTSKKGDIEQYELTGDEKGKVAGKKVRSWRIGKSEAVAADDEEGKIYISEEDRGVWEVGGEPEDPTPGKLVIRLGENGLTGDIEGLAIYYKPDGAGYLIVSNQGKDNFKVYQRSGTHEFVGTFAIQGARKTDGLDVVNANLGPQFPNGLFACHTGEGNCPVLLTPWEKIADAVLHREKAAADPGQNK
ncbi:MAG: phytase [Deltaproteobacteria bacterium]|nr:phytase [Deltaproteobacteria bacterium]